MTPYQVSSPRLHSLSLSLLLFLLLLCLLLVPISSQAEAAAEADLNPNPNAEAVVASPPSPSDAAAPPAPPATPSAPHSPLTRSRRGPGARHVHRNSPFLQDANSTSLSGDDHLIPHGSHFHTESENEAASGYILLILLAVLLASQAGLWVWRKRHVRSFDQAALLGLWLIPALWSLYSDLWRMLAVWLLYSAVTAWVGSKALKRQVDRSTPRLVYQYFYACYRTCYGTAFAGYLLLMAEFLGFSLLLPDALTPLAPTGFLLLFYGLYYGVLSRDLCQVCSQALAVNIGYVAAQGEMPSKSLPTNTCAICDHPLHSSVRLTDATTTADEPVVTIGNCGHSFHIFCIRGWALVGKSRVCPCCHERVDLRQLLGPAAWEQTVVAWAMVLDAMRYLIVFNPLILLLSQGVIYLLY